MEKLKIKNKTARYFFIVFIILFLVAVDNTLAAQQDIEQKIDMIINVLSSPKDDRAKRQNSKNAILDLLTEKQDITKNPLVNDLINVFLGNGTTREDSRSSRLLQDSKIGQIVDIINPNVNNTKRQRWKKTVKEILNGTYGKEPERPGEVKPSKIIRKGVSLTTSATVLVSDQISNRFKGTNAIDGLENTEWVAKGSRGKWLTLKWHDPVDIKYIGLLGRRQDISVHIWSSDIIFSDGTIIDFGSLEPARFRQISVNKKQITWLKYYIREGENNVGLSEIEVRGDITVKGAVKPSLFPANLAQKATISVSSSLKNRYSGKKAIDRNPMTEWVAKSAENQWLRLSWNKEIQIDHIKLKGRVGDSASRIEDAFIVFSDGDITKIKGGLDANQVKTIKGRHKKIMWLKLYIRYGQHKAGLAEIVVKGNIKQKQKIAANLAQKATARVSDQISRKYRAELVKDRNLDTQWVAKAGKDKWVSLEWDRPVSIGKLSLTAGKGLENGRILDSVLILSDGSLIPVGKIKPGKTITLSIDRSEMWWVKFFIRKGQGKIGVAEIVVREW